MNILLALRAIRHIAIEAGYTQTNLNCLYVI